MPIVNGHQVECGCYVDGHWGQYGPDHLADKASDFGWEPEKPTDDPRVLRVFADELESGGYHDAAGMLWEWHSEAADNIETWLNDHTATVCTCGDEIAWDDKSEMWRHFVGRQHAAHLAPIQFTWHWHDGEFFLSPICENGDCDDDTCAHWD